MLLIGKIWAQKMEDSLAKIIVAAAIEVHRSLGGAGLLENIYEAALCHELSLHRVTAQRQVPIPVLYKGKQIREPLFLDLLVENKVVVEIKATEKIFPFYQAQLFTYLRLTGMSMGLLINFGKERIEEGIQYMMNPIQKAAP